MKLYNKPCCLNIRKHHFLQRIISLWNALPNWPETNLFASNSSQSSAAVHPGPWRAVFQLVPQDPEGNGISQGAPRSRCQDRDAEVVKGVKMLNNILSKTLSPPSATVFTASIGLAPIRLKPAWLKTFHGGLRLKQSMVAYGGGFAVYPRPHHSFLHQTASHTLPQC